MSPPPYYSNLNPGFRAFAKVWTTMNVLLWIVFLSLYAGSLPNEQPPPHGVWWPRNCTVFNVSQRNNNYGTDSLVALSFSVTADNDSAHSSYYELPSTTLIHATAMAYQALAPALVVHGNETLFVNRSIHCYVNDASSEALIGDARDFEEDYEEDDDDDNGSTIYLSFMVITLVAWTTMLGFLLLTCCSQCLACDEQANRLQMATPSSDLTQPLTQSVYFSVRN
jgi:hypothetical protein